jgi:hypothetical protein
MNDLTCKECNKIFTSKQSLSYHSRKSVCKKVIKYVCKCCDKELSSRSSLYRHKQTCKNKNDKKSDEINEGSIIVTDNIDVCKIYERLLELEKENNTLKKKVNKIEKNPSIVNNTTNTTNNNCNINNGTVNNIYLVGYGKEDMSKISYVDLLKGIKSGFNSTINLIDAVHFNPEYPEYHNVYISSMKNKYAMMYDGNDWTLVMKDDLIDKLYDDKRNYIEENLEDFLESLTASQKNALHRWMEADNDHPYIKKIKNDIKLLLYNKRHLSIKTKNGIAYDIDEPDDNIRVIKKIKDAEIHDLDYEFVSSSIAKEKAKGKSKKIRRVKVAPRLGTKRKTINRIIN